MTVLHVNDMHCSHCVARIDTALNALGLTAGIDLEKKTVSVDCDEHRLKEVINALDDIGFEAVTE